MTGIYIIAQPMKGEIESFTTLQEDQTFEERLKTTTPQFGQC